MDPFVVKSHPNGASIWIPVEPVPASRPRVTRWGVYYGKRYTRFRKEVSEILGRKDLPKDLPLSGPLKATVKFYVAKPKSTKREWPNGDLDNYLKTLDSFNGVFWLDDDQIVEFEAYKRFMTVEVDGFHEPGIMIILRRPTKE
jgi:Holliday junction resolvase RusA-like endonuclease